MTQENTQEKKQDENLPKREDGVIFIGSKPFKNYVQAVTISFRDKQLKEVLIKARGHFINRAVDVMQVAIKVLKKENNKNLIELEEPKIKVEDLEFDDKKNEGKKIRISAMEITLRKRN